MRKLLIPNPHKRTGFLLKYILLVSYFVWCVSELLHAQYIPNCFEERSVTLNMSQSLEWGNYDKDANLDILLTGKSNPERQALIYRYDGNDVYTLINANLVSVTYSFTAWGDYDNDGDLDIFLSGETDYINHLNTARIYRNDGNDIFSDIGATLPALSRGGAQWKDLDNDGDLDLCLTGRAQSTLEPSTYIIQNLGNNNFITLDILPVKCYGSIKSGDLNNDLYNDIIVSGYDINGNKHTSLYMNNGDMTFTEIEANLYAGGTEISLGDYDSDGDIDILASKYTVGNYPIIYRNEGNNSFTAIQLIISELESVLIATWADFDNDGDLDILSSGQKWINNYTTLTYRTILSRNDGGGTFSKMDLGFQQGNPISVNWGDYDNDGDLDILYNVQDCIGSGCATQYFTKLLRNNYNAGNTIPITPSNLVARDGNNITLSWNTSSDPETPSGSITYNLSVSNIQGTNNIMPPMSDNQTGRRFLPVQGNVGSNTTWFLKNLPQGNYYWKVQSVDNVFGASAFSGEYTFTVLPVISKVNLGYGDYGGSATFGDYDNDGKLDLAISGYKTEYFTKILHNNGNNSFSDINAGIPGVANSCLDWGDYDKDGDLDLFISGYATSEPVCKIYRNDGNNSFTDINLTLQGQFYFYSAGWGDYDNDGDLDLATEYDIYRNDGKDVFVPINVGFTYNPYSAQAWGDYDNDGYIDLVYSGTFESTFIYHNNGDGTFTKRNLNLKGLQFTSVCWGDFNNDGFLDLVLTGKDNIYNNHTIIYRNNGDGTFTDINANVRFIESGSAIWMDFDNDGNLDILIKGRSGTWINKLYRNNGNETFSEISLGLPNSQTEQVGYGDSDNDGDIDIVFNDTDYNKKLFVNNGNYPNKQPSVPSNLRTERIGYGFKFIWDKSTDLNSAQGGLSYNIRIGTAQGAADIVCPMSDLQSGKVNLPKPGNAGLNTFFILNNLNEGTYYWSVQSIDQNYSSSSWATEQSLTVTVLRADFSASTACLGSVTNFEDLSLSSGPQITSWSWDFGDGTTSTQINPQHTYDSYGTYNVTLTIGSGVYSDYITKPVTVNNKPSANFNAPIVCQGTSTTFTNTTNNNGLTGLTWLWNFGDTQTTTLQNPDPHYYNAANYSVILQATAGNGCMDEITKTVTVAAYPEAAISASGLLSFCEGGSVTLSVPLNASYTYTWKRDGAPITGANANTYIATLSGSYSVVVVNSVGGCVTTSSPITVTVNTSPAAPLISASGPITFCQGDAIDLSVTYTSGYSYQWKLNGGAVGANASTYSATAAGTYSLEVTNSFNCKANSSNTVDVTVNPIPSIPTVNISGTTTFCQGSSVELSVASTGGYTYQWENNGSAITGSTSNTYVANSSGIYSLKITNSSNCFSRTENVTVTVLPSPIAPTISADGSVTFCQGESVGLSVTGITGDSYQWKLNGGAVGSNSNSYSAGASGTYTLVVTNSSSCSVNATNSVAITVNPKPTVPTVNISGPTAFCQGDNVELSVTTTPGYEYQWENNGSGITGAIYNSYTAQASGNYTLSVINAYSCSAKTENVAVIVAAAPSAPLISAGGPQVFCQGDSVVLSITPTSGYNYQWKLNGGTIGTSTSLFNAKNAGTYSLTVSNDIGCSSNSTNTLDVTVNPKPSLPTVNVSGPTSFCMGNSVDLSVSSTTGYTYQWENNGAAISSAVSNTFTANTSGIYSLRITNTNNCYIKTENVNVNVLTVPSAPTISTSGSSTFCSGDSVTLSVTDTPGYTFQWKLNGGDVGTNLNRLVAKTTGEYSLLVTNSNGCSVSSVSPVPVIVNPMPVMSIISVKGNEKFCSGESATLSVPANTAYSYNWRRGTNLLDITTNSIVASEPGEYSIDISLAGCSMTAETVKIEVVQKPAKPAIDTSFYDKGMCLGETPLKISVDGAVAGYNYKWYRNGTPLSNSISVEVLEEGIYYLEAISDICTSLRDSAVIDFRETLPKPDIIARGPTVWMLSTTSRANQYKWFLNGSLIPGAGTSSFVAAQNYGIYRLAVSDASGCFSFSDTLRIPLGVTGIDDADPFEDVKIYPNPTTGMFTIEMNNNIFGELIIDIFSQNGRKMLNIKLEKTTEHFQSQIDLSGQSKGMYLINLSLDKFKAVRKVLVE